MSKAQTPGMLDLHDYVRTVNIQHPLRGVIPFSPYDFQVDLIQHVEDNPLAVLSIARQMGSTTSIMAWVLWTAAARPDSRIIIMSNALWPSLEALDRARFMLETSPAAVPYVRENTKSRIAFNNGSFIEAKAAKPLDYDATYTHLVMMNAGFIAPPRIKDAWPTFQPHINRGMRVVMQCGGGRAGSQYHHVVKNADSNGFKLLKQDWRVHPYRDEAWAEPYKLQLGERRFREEFENVFTDYED